MKTTLKNIIANNHDIYGISPQIHVKDLLEYDVYHEQFTRLTLEIHSHTIVQIIFHDTIEKI